MTSIQVTRLDIEVLNDCLVDLPAEQFASSSESSLLRTKRMLRNMWIAEAYSNMHASWKGVDDNEAWAA